VSAQRPRQQAGFTLLELLVAITLLGALMAALFGALRLGTRVWETGEAQLDASARTQVVQDFLRQQLGQTVPLIQFADRGRIDSMLFVGTSDWVRFVSMLPEHLGAGARLMELERRESTRSGGSADLVIRIQPLDPTENDGATADDEERVLIENIESLEINYFGSASPNAKAVWWQQWQDQRDLPRLIRIRVDFPPDDRRLWPELIIALMVDLPPVSQL